MTDVSQAIESVFRQEYGRILSGLIRQAGDFERAEEALQDALTIALERWTAADLPERPAAWIATTARRRLIDRFRRERLDELKLADLHEHRRGEDGLATDPIHAQEELPDQDDRLRLIFTCCHPALHHEAQVALTLNALCGLTSSEIARAFLVKESTLAQRLVRAKRKIREAGIPYRVPPASLLSERLPAVLTVCYLVFNEGYSAARGDELIRRELCSESIRLARVLDQLLPGEPEVEGLLALMLLQDSRSEARFGDDGLVLLEDQDRSRWDREAITEGLEILETALRKGRAGPYQVQAAIAAVHAEAERAEDTDWPQIVLLYDAYLDFRPSPVVELNRAVAVAMTAGPAEALASIEGLRGNPEMESYLYFHSTRAELLRRLGRIEESKAAYGAALGLAANTAERDFLTVRLRALDEERPPSLDSARPAE